MEEQFTARSKPANLVTTRDFDKKLTSFNRKTTSNKTKFLEVQNKLSSLITNIYKFFLSRISFKVIIDLKRCLQSNN